MLCEFYGLDMVIRIHVLLFLKGLLKAYQEKNNKIKIKVILLSTTISFYYYTYININPIFMNVINFF